MFKVTATYVSRSLVESRFFEHQGKVKFVREIEGTNEVLHWGEETIFQFIGSFQK